MRADELDLQLEQELGAVARGMRLPPLQDIHRRARRRHRHRLTRRASTAVALAVLAGGITLNGSFTGSDVTPAAPDEDRPCVRTAIDPKSLDPDLRLLPEHLPAGTALHEVQATGRSECGGTTASAWHVDPASGRIDRTLVLTPVPQQVLATGNPTAGECAAFVAPGESGTCVQAEVTGKQRRLWRSTPANGGQAVAWLESGIGWRLEATGVSSAALDTTLAKLRTDGDRIVADTLPAKMQTWTAPARTAGSVTLSASYLPRPENGAGDLQEDPAGKVDFTVTRDPREDPFTDPLDRAGERPGARDAHVVDVDGSPGIWRRDPQNNSTTLSWRGKAGLTLHLTGGELTLNEALTVARSVRPVDAGDPRLVCDAKTSLRENCGG